MRTYVLDRAAERPHTFRRAIERRALWMAEDAARELPNLPLEDALQLVHLYAERDSPKYERAALRWLERYLVEGSPRLEHFAEMAMKLAKRQCPLIAAWPGAPVQALRVRTPMRPGRRRRLPAGSGRRGREAERGCGS